MAQTIANDPKNRKIFSAQEDDITTELNENWKSTVERENQFRSEIDEHDTKISSLETDVSDHESRLSTVETDIADNLEESHYSNLLAFLDVCEVSSDANSGATSLDVTSTSMPLEKGDKLEAFDPSSGTGTTITVDADATTGTTTLTVQSLPSSVSSGTTLMLSRPDLKPEVSADSFRTICKLTSDATSGATSIDVTSTTQDLTSGDTIYTFDEASGTGQAVTIDADASAGSTTLQVQSLSSQISADTQMVLSNSVNLSSWLTTAERDITSLQSSVSSISSDVSANSSDIDKLRTRLNSNDGLVANVESDLKNLEDKVQLSNTTTLVGKLSVGKVDDPNNDLDGSSTTDELPVKQVDKDLFQGQTLVIEDKENGNHTFVQVGDNSSAGFTPSKPLHKLDEAAFTQSSGTVKLQNSYSLDVKDGANIYLETSTMQSSFEVMHGAAVARVEKNNMVSELSVQLDKITAETDIFQSENFDGTVDRSGSLATYDPSAPGTTGWALFEDGTVIGHNSLFRGESEMTKATITNGLTLDLGAFINDPESNFSITEHGFDIRAIDGKSINQGRMFGIRDTNDQTIGGFTAKLQPDPQIIVDATGDPGTNSPNAQFLARSTGQAEIESSDGPVILSANPNGGKIVLDGDRVIAKNVQKASSESGLSSPVDGEVWMDTDNKTLKMYEAGTLPTPVATPDFAVTEIGDKKVRFISTTRVTTGRITGFDWSFDDGATDSGSPVVAHTYGSTGSYDATLTVTFDEGSTMSTTQTVSVDGDGFSLPILKDIRTDMDVR